MLFRFIQIYFYLTQIIELTHTLVITLQKDAVNTQQYIEIKKNTSLTLICPTAPVSTSFIDWYKNSEKLEWSIQNHVKILNNKLIIRQTRVLDTGLYECKILNGNGQQKIFNITIKVISGDSQDMNLTTTKKMSSSYDDYNYDDNNYYDDYLRGESPKFLDSDSKIQYSINKLEKSIVKLNCNARGMPMPDIIWYKNGKIISEEDIGNIRNSMILTIKDLSLSDTGNYTCQLTNQYGKINRKFHVKILETLKFDDMNANVDVNVTTKMNDNSVFKCKIQHNIDHLNDKAQIMWFTKTNKNPNIQVNSNLSVDIDGDLYYFIDKYQQFQQNKIQILNDDSYLIIKNVDFHDIGYYLCIANNSYGYNYRKIYLNIVSYLNDDASNTPLSINVILIISSAIILFLVIFILMYIYKNTQCCHHNRDLIDEKTIASKLQHNERKSFTKIPSNTISSNGSACRFVPQQGKNMQVNKNNFVRQASITSSSTKYNYNTTTSTITKQEVPFIQQQQQAAINYENFMSLSKQQQHQYKQHNLKNWSDGGYSESSNQSRPYAKILNI